MSVLLPEMIAARFGHRKGRPTWPHGGWDEPAFRAYADYMESEAFRSAIDDLVPWAREGTTAAMCAEATPLRCHRRFLSDALTHVGVEVGHLLGPGAQSPHEWTAFARVEGMRIIYDGGTLHFTDPTG